MAHYQLAQIDLSTRIGLASEMLDPERGRGQVTELARKYEVSRKFLYELKAKGQAALEVGLEGQKPGPKAPSRAIQVDRAFLRRAVISLSLLPPSIRNLQAAIELLFGQHCALGFIEQTLQQAGARARAENQELQPQQPIQAELDEIFQTRHPCLTLIDGASGLLLNLVRQADCDATTWGVTLLDLQRQGITFEDLASDGSLSIRTGIQEAQLQAPYRPDWFHLTQTGHEISRKLENQAYAALETAERARLFQQAAQALKPRLGRPLKPTVAYPLAAQAADQAMHTFDLWSWLFAELRQTLQPVQASGQLVSAQLARQNLTLIIAWLQDLQVSRATSFAKNLGNLMDLLLAPFETLEQRLAPLRTDLDPRMETFLLWAWFHRQQLDLHIERDLPLALQPLALAFWQALNHFHRTSCLAECLHSWLRPFLVLHRGMPDWLLPLLQSFWNHHLFQRGKRRGHNPLALAEIPTPLDPSCWINQLLPLAV
jgi:hypothetical protein